MQLPVFQDASLLQQMLKYNYNTLIFQQLSSQAHCHYAYDSFEECRTTNFIAPQAALDYYMFHPPSGFPPYKLMLKSSAVYHLLRNFSISLGLVKNVHVILTDIGQHVITVWKLLNDANTNYIDSQNILLPQI